MRLRVGNVRRISAMEYMGREGVVRIRMGRRRGGRVWRILLRGGDFWGETETLSDCCSCSAVFSFLLFVYESFSSARTSESWDGLCIVCRLLEYGIFIFHFNGIWRQL
jgi:hypothetical protein